MRLKGDTRPRTYSRMERAVAAVIIDYPAPAVIAGRDPVKIVHAVLPVPLGPSKKK